MRKLLSLFLLVFISIQFSQSQVPQGFNYQAVVRNSSGQPVISQSVSFQIKILQGAIDGTSVYSETHLTTTTDLGLVTLKIGEGTTTDDFSLINWGSASYFIQVKMDESGGSDYQLMGTLELLSVPYAMYAKNVANYNEIDPLFDNSVAKGITQADTMAWNNKLETEIDGDVTNEIQTLSEVLTEGADAGGNYITNLANPLNSQDATTKAYVDELKKQINIIELSLLNELGTVWTSDTTGKVQDIDGNIYQFIKIGDQFWMTENLLTKRYSNGDSIPPGKGVGNICIYLTPKYYFEKYDNIYGIFYSYYVVSDSRNICPSGWHVPLYDELGQLANFIQINQGSLKEVGFEHWNSPNQGATDSHGFTALPNGFVDCNGAGYDSRIKANFWSSTDYSDNDYAWTMILSWDSNNVRILPQKKKNVGGLVVRCIKNKY